MLSLFVCFVLVVFMIFDLFSQVFWEWDVDLILCFLIFMMCLFGWDGVGFFVVNVIKMVYFNIKLVCLVFYIVVFKSLNWRECYGQVFGFQMV